MLRILPFRLYCIGYQDSLLTTIDLLLESYSKMATHYLFLLLTGYCSIVSVHSLAPPQQQHAVVVGAGKKLHGNIFGIFSNCVSF